MMIRYGIIGFGRFAERVIAPAIRAAPHSTLAAIQKRSLGAAQEKAAQYSIPLAFDSVLDLVKNPNVDAVFIASANSCHCPETLLAARAGKHVIVEKPMAMNVAEAEQMVEVCAKHHVKLMVGHMLRLSPLTIRMRDLVRSGDLGRIMFARADFMYDARLSQREWLYDRRIAGGGPVFDIGVHCLDTLRFVLQDEPVSVTSELEPRPTETSVETNAQILLRFSKGTIGSVWCSYDTPIRESSIDIVGTEKMLSASDFTVGNRTASLTIIAGSKDTVSERRVEEVRVPNLYVEEISHFSECILDDSEPALSGANGVQNQHVLDEALRGAG